jgi:hypothetical protein
MLHLKMLKKSTIKKKSRGLQHESLPYQDQTKGDGKELREGDGRDTGSADGSIGILGKEMEMDRWRSVIANCAATGSMELSCDEQALKRDGEWPSDRGNVQSCHSCYCCWVWREIETAPVDRFGRAEVHPGLNHHFFGEKERPGRTRVPPEGRRGGAGGRVGSLGRVSVVLLPRFGRSCPGLDLDR